MANINKLQVKRQEAALTVSKCQKNKGLTACHNCTKFKSCAQREVLKELDIKLKDATVCKQMEE